MIQKIMFGLIFFCMIISNAHAEFVNGEFSIGNGSNFTGTGWTPSGVESMSGTHDGDDYAWEGTAHIYQELGVCRLCAYAYDEGYTTDHTVSVYQSIDLTGYDTVYTSYNTVNLVGSGGHGIIIDGNRYGGSVDVSGLSGFHSVGVFAYAIASQYGPNTNYRTVDFDYIRCTGRGPPQPHQFTFIDKCGYTIKNMHGVYSINGDMWEGFYESDGVLSIDCYDTDQIEIMSMTWQGSHRYNVTAGTGKSLLDPTIYQSFNLHVSDYETGNPIQYVYISAYQECVIKYSNTKNSQTNENGDTMIPFLSGCTCDIDVWCEGYTGGSISIKIPIGAQTPYRDLFLTLGVGIDPIWEWEENTTETEGNDTGVPLNDTDFYGTQLAFYNTDGDLTNKINASDEYVDMEFYIHRRDRRYMTCNFEQFLDDVNYWLPKISYIDMPNNFSYRKRIYNDNFTHAGMYRAYLFNYVNSNMDIVLNLEVYNDTEIQHLENLTAYVWFLNKLYGNQIDYKEPVKIVVYANSTNSTLLNINVSFWNQSTCTCYELLDWADFFGADTKYYYEWNPEVEYDAGYNYTVKIHTYEGMLLGVDEVWTDNIRNNKLTIVVKDQSGNNLNNSFIFLEGWGSLYTGNNNYYNSYTGLGNDTFRYKASKRWYTGHGWDSVSLDTEDKTVVYTLVSYVDGERARGLKTTDDEMTVLFIPVILFMFIAILIGGFIYVCK